MALIAATINYLPSQNKGLKTENFYKSNIISLKQHNHITNRVRPNSQVNSSVAVTQPLMYGSLHSSKVVPATVGNLLFDEYVLTTTIAETSQCGLKVKYWQRIRKGNGYPFDEADNLIHQANSYVYQRASDNISRSSNGLQSSMYIILVQLYFLSQGKRATL